MVFFKANKSGRIQERVRKKILEDYFGGSNVQKICTKYGYKDSVIRKYLASRATKIYIDSTGHEWRRCSRCSTYKKREEYGNHQKKGNVQYIKPHCKFCERVVQRNRNQIKRNTDNHYDLLYWGRLSWYKNGWKYNFRRRILKVIGYMDRNGKIIGNKKERI